MSDLGPELGARDDAAEANTDMALHYCECACHSSLIANARAGIDGEGREIRRSYTEADFAFWKAAMPALVSRMDPVAAAAACPACRASHTLVFSSQPALHHPSPPRHGPNGRCEPDCRWCRQLDSVPDEPRK